MTEPCQGVSADANWQTATVVAIDPQTPRIKSFFLKPQTPFHFRAGQHVDLRLTAENGYTAMRSYSIGSSPSDNRQIELSIERLDDGEVSPFFHNVVAIGDEVEVRGPLGGHFTWSSTDGGPLLLVGGGSGVVPLMSMIRHQQDSAPTVPLVLLLSARTWDNILYRDQLLEMDRLSRGFNLALALTRESPKRNGDFGRRVDNAMVAEILQRLPAPPKLVYVCGSNPFVNVATDGIISCNVPAKNIRTERYGV